MARQERLLAIYAILVAVWGVFFLATFSNYYRYTILDTVIAVVIGVGIYVWSDSHPEPKPAPQRPQTITDLRVKLCEFESHWNVGGGWAEKIQRDDYKTSMADELSKYREDLITAHSRVIGEGLSISTILDSGTQDIIEWLRGIIEEVQYHRAAGNAIEMGNRIVASVNTKLILQLDKDFPL